MEQSPASRFVDVLGLLGYTTQQKIADLLQIARPTAGTIVRREREPSFADVYRLKQEHDEVNIDYIFTGKGAPFERNLTLVAQLPPAVLSKLDPPQAPTGLGNITAEQARANMAALGSTSLEDKATIAYLREQVERQAEELRQMRDQMALDRDRNHERETQLIVTIGNLGKPEASADAADTTPTNMRVSYVNPDQVAAEAFRRRRPAMYYGPVEAQRTVIQGFV